MAPLIVITGPTASGKTGLAIELAERYGGEIVCADSRTIYRGMDIGTAKPTPAEQRRVPHHLLDVVEPGQKYTAADFQRDANVAIAEIRQRGNIPFLVGGTGLYIDAVVREYEWPVWSEDQAQRDTLEQLSIDELQSMLKNQRIPLPTNSRNQRHLVAALMRDGKQGSARILPRETTHVVAIATDKTVLIDRIRQRAYAMFDDGVIEEAQRLGDVYGWDSEAMSSNIYPIVKRVINGEITTEQAIELFIIKDTQLVKRQLGWLKRHSFVQWLGLAEARSYIETIL